MMKKIIYLVFVLIAFTTSLSAQKLTGVERMAMVDSLLTQRYYNTPYDTNFVVRPEGQLTLKVRMNQTGNDFHAKGTVNDVYAKADLKTSYRITYSIAAIYCGIGIGCALNQAKLNG